MAFPTILLRTSPDPIGRIPGFLSSSIRRLAVYASRQFGSVTLVAIFLAKMEIWSRKSFPSLLNCFEQRILLN